MTDDDDADFADFDEDEFLEAWDEADRQAAEVLAEACREVLAEPAPADELDRAVQELRDGLATRRDPFEYFLLGCGWEGTGPDDPLTLWLDAAAATVSPANDPGTDAELQAAVFALEHADWVGMVTGLVRRGPGASFDPESVEDDIATSPEIEGDVDESEGALEVLSLAVEVLTPLWQALGILDRDARLTVLGRWGVPRAVLAAWEHDET